MADYYIKSGSGVTDFAISTAYGLGDRVCVNPADTGSNYSLNRPFVWECTTAGTTAGAFPSWPVGFPTADSTTFTSGTATFTARNSGYSSGSTVNWSFANPHLYYVVGSSIFNSGDRAIVSNHHNETYTGNMTSSNPLNLGGASANRSALLCVDDSAAPPTALATGAVFAVTGSVSLSGYSNVYGVNLKAGNLSAYNSSAISFLNSAVELTDATASNRINLGYSLGAFNTWEFVNTAFKFANTGQGFSAGVPNVAFKMRGCSIDPTGSAITTLFAGQYDASGHIDGCDFSACASTLNFVTSSNYNQGDLIVRNCKLPASWTGALSSFAMGQFSRFEMWGCDNGSRLVQHHVEDWFDLLVDETTIVRSNGAVDLAGTAYSWKLTSYSGAKNGPYGALARLAEIQVPNTVTGVSRTATVEFVHDSLTALTDLDLWLEIAYLGTSGQTINTILSKYGNPLGAGTAHAASSGAWTTTGMTNPNRQKMTVSFTPQMVGMVTIRVFMSKPSYTVYVDPAVTLS